MRLKKMILDTFDRSIDVDRLSMVEVCVQLGALVLTACLLLMVVFCLYAGIMSLGNYCLCFVP